MDAGLFQLAGIGSAHTFIAGVNLSPTATPAAGAWEMDLTMANIGLSAGDSFNYIGTYGNASSFRSDEFQGVAAGTVPSGNPGATPVSLGAGDFNTFNSVAAIPEPTTAGLLVISMLSLLGLRRRNP